MSDFENLDIMHRMCQLELLHLKQNISAYEKRSVEIFNTFGSSQVSVADNAIALVAYDNFCTNLTNVMHLARKLNLHFCINSLEDESSGMLFQTIKTNAISFDLMANSSSSKTKSDNRDKNAALELTPELVQQLEQTNFKNHQSTMIEPEKTNTHNYKSCSIPPIDLTDNQDTSLSSSHESASYISSLDINKFQEGCKIAATVTYIQNMQELKFFICEVASESAAKILQLGKMKHLQQYRQMPAVGEIFGLVLDDIILRAVRENTHLPGNAKSLKQPELDDVCVALLLDCGDLVCISDEHIMYKLSDEYQQMPAQAIPCILFHETVEQKNAMQELLRSWKYQRVNLQVVKNDGDFLYVKHNANNEQMGNDKASMLIADTNPFKEELLADIKKNKIKKELELEAIPLSAMPIKQKKVTRKDFTEEELEMLYDEDQGTSNAMKAVMGYDPKDEKRICRFYNVKTRSCFKGSTCRQEHTLLSKDGWTKDVLPAAAVIDSRIPASFYNDGALICITPTYIGELERFYCQINDPHKTTEPLVWDADEISATLRLHRAPLIFDLVLARYKDGMWYRAKIIEMDDDCKMFKVFYVDYGNHEVVHLRNLSKCDYATAKLPYQAVLCRLDGVRANGVTEIAEKRKKAIDTLCTHILNKQVMVKVVCHSEEQLIVRIVDKEFDKLPEKLAEIGAIKPLKPQLTPAYRKTSPQS